MIFFNKLPVFKHPQELLIFPEKVVLCNLPFVLVSGFIITFLMNVKFTRKFRSVLLLTRRI